MIRSQVDSSMSSGFVDDPQEDDEQPPDVAACFMASKSIGFMRLSSEIVNGWLMCRVSCRRDQERKARAIGNSTGSQ